MTDETIPVWIRESADGKDFSLWWWADIQEAYDDYLDTTNRAIVIEGWGFAPSRVYKAVAPVDYEQGFAAYRTYYREVQVPADIVHSTPLVKDWLRTYLMVDPD